MKKLIILLSLVAVLGINMTAQVLNHSDLNSGFKLKGHFTAYMCKDGILYHVGDTLNIGTPSSGETFTYIVNSNMGFSQIISSDVFPPMDIRESNSLVVIKNIKLWGKKKNGYLVLFGVRTTQKFLPSTYDIRIECAVSNGEIVTNFN
jgi:hypothetical protein